MSTVQNVHARVFGYRTPHTHMSSTHYAHNTVVRISYTFYTHNKRKQCACAIAYDKAACVSISTSSDLEFYLSIPVIIHDCYKINTLCLCSIRMCVLCVCFSILRMNLFHEIIDFVIDCLFIFRSVRYRCRPPKSIYFERNLYQLYASVFHFVISHMLTFH